MVLNNNKIRCFFEVDKYRQKNDFTNKQTNIKKKTVTKDVICVQVYLFKCMAWVIELIFIMVNLAILNKTHNIRTIIYDVQMWQNHNYWCNSRYYLPRLDTAGLYMVIDIPSVFTLFSNYIYIYILLLLLL